MAMITVFAVGMFVASTLGVMLTICTGWRLCQVPAAMTLFALLMAASGSALAVIHRNVGKVPDSAVMLKVVTLVALVVLVRANSRRYFPGAAFFPVVTVLAVAATALVVFWR